MTEFKIPVAGVGPGSQPSEEDGADLAYLPMPQEVATYRMPEIEYSISSLEGANQVLRQIQELLDHYRVGDATGSINLSVLDGDNLELIDQLLGEGEVSILIQTDPPVRCQESVLAGVWRVQYLDGDGGVDIDLIEVADIPRLIRQQTFTAPEIRRHVDMQDKPEGVNNAIPLLAELNDKIAVSDNSTEPYVINLTLLPQSDEDIAFLQQRLGTGPVTILSRGYGNCRVTSTTTRNVWWVQYFNSQDAIILNTLEVIPVPIVVCASQEDIEDSAERLQEIREVYA